MAYKLHVATTYQVKYDHKVTPFRNKAGAVNRFLFEHCPNMHWDECADSCESASTIEIPKAELLDLAGWIAFHQDQYAEWASANGIEESAERFIEITRYWRSHCDQRNDFVILSWH